MLKVRRLEEKIARLEAANAELQAFAAAVAHDLRAPLRNLTGLCGHLEAELGQGLTPIQRDLFARVKGSAARMDAIILGLLQLSRVSRQPLDPVSFDIGELAEAVVEELRRAEPGRKVRFVRTPELVARVDPVLTRVLLRALLDNAWKFTAVRPSARVELGVVRRRGVTAFFVRDDGPGFELTRPERLFTPFQRFHSAVEFPGSGIGLAVVKRAVERHGGRVWAETAPGRGATFYFTLPGAATEAAAARSAAAAGTRKRPSSPAAPC